MKHFYVQKRNMTFGIMFHRFIILKTLVLLIPSSATSASLITIALADDATSEAHVLRIINL